MMLGVKRLAVPNPLVEAILHPTCLGMLLAERDASGMHNLLAALLAALFVFLTVRAPGIEVSDAPAARCFAEVVDTVRRWLGWIFGVSRGLVAAVQQTCVNLTANEPC